MLSSLACLFSSGRLIPLDALRRFDFGVIAAAMLKRVEAILHPAFY